MTLRKDKHDQSVKAVHLPSVFKQDRLYRPHYIRTVEQLLFFRDRMDDFGEYVTSPVRLRY
jgi:hypothetical protein